MKTKALPERAALLTVKKASQNFPRKRKTKSKLFSAAARTWTKTLLRLQVWNLSVKDRQIMRAADCKELAEKAEGLFRQAKALPERAALLAYFRGRVWKISSVMALNSTGSVDFLSRFHSLSQPSKRLWRKPQFSFRRKMAFRLPPNSTV